MSYSNYSDQLIFCINTQDSRAVVLLNRPDVNKNLQWFAVTTFLQGLMNKAPEILFSCITHWCCFCGFVLQINQSGHQVQVLTKINVGNNVLCIGHSVGFCREHTYKQTTFRLRVWTDGWVEKPCVKQRMKKKCFMKQTHNSGWWKHTSPVWVILLGNSKQLLLTAGWHSDCCGDAIMYNTDCTCPYTAYSCRCVSALLRTLDDTQIDVCGRASSHNHNPLRVFATPITELWSFLFDVWSNNSPYKTVNKQMNCF